MLRLETRAVSDKATKRLLERIALRVEAVSWVYELMRLDAARSAIRLLAYFRQVCRAVEQQTGAARRKWQIDVSGDDVPVSLDEAVNIGMLVTELLSDAAGADFGDGETPGTITLDCRLDGTDLVITLTDGRRGTLAEGPRANEPMLGKKLVGVYVSALQGRMEQTGTRGDGLETTVRFHYNGATIFDGKE